MSICLVAFLAILHQCGMQWFKFFSLAPNFYQPCLLCLLLMLFIIQGRKLVTNFYMPPAPVIFNQFVKQLHKLTGLHSRLNLDQTWCSIILWEQMDATDYIKPNFNQLWPNFKACVRYFLKIHYTSELIT